MAEDNEDIQLELEELPKDDLDPIIEKTDAPTKKVIEPEEGLETLKAKLAQEQADHAATKRREVEASNIAVRARNEVQDANLTVVENALDRLAQTSAVLKSNYAALLQNGQFADAAEVQEQMSRTQAEIMQLEDGKRAIEAQPKAQAPQLSDPVEAMASQLSPRSASWVRSHPEFATNQRLTQKMLAAHNLAVADDLQPDSDDYFRAIEQTLGLQNGREIALDDTMAHASRATGGRSIAPASAPVSRSSGPPGSSPNTIRLSREQLEIAELNHQTPQEYARELIKIQKEQGRLN